MIKKFKFDLFIGFSNLIYVFVGRGFGPNFDPDNEWDRTFIDFVAELDDYYIELGKLKPTQMIAGMIKEQKSPTKIYKLSIFQAIKHEFKFYVNNIFLKIAPFEFRVSLNSK